MKNSFNTKTEITCGKEKYTIFDISKINGVEKLPYSIKILLENLVRNEDDITVNKNDIESIIDWHNHAAKKEIAYRPARVLMQDFTGVPAVVDLAAMRDAIKKLGKSPSDINPLQPAELVIDHSVQVDNFGSNKAFGLNAKLEYERNFERYKFLKWGQSAFSNFKVVPPDTGIVHQINIEFLARCIFTKEIEGSNYAYPDTVVGTDSHTTMINGIGVLGWGVGGIEAEASMLGQPISMLIPKVVGFKLTGKVSEGVTATDLVLNIVEMLRIHGVVGKFVEFYGDGLDNLSLGDRATIANMAPEYGATCGIFPVDEETIDYMRLSNRDEAQIELIKKYTEAVGLTRNDCDNAIYTENIELDISKVEPSIAGPKRPQDRINLKDAKASYEKELKNINPQNQASEITIKDSNFSINNGDIVIAAITSCTNTSNPSVMIAAGLVAKKARELGLKSKPWVKTSLAPGSMVVTEYLKNSNLLKPMEELGFHNVGYGCATCIGNSGPLIKEISDGIKENNLIAASVLSGNRNFEGRVHAEVKLNYLASPPLVIAYAIAGSMNIDITTEPISVTDEGKEIYLKDIWPSNSEINKILKSSLTAEQFKKSYENIYDGEKEWKNIDVTENNQYEWDESTYIANPPYFDDMCEQDIVIDEIKSARVLAYLGDSVTTDHISPAGNIKEDSPAGKYLISKNVDPNQFNSYGSRRGNHKVMMRGTFANIRLKNKLVPHIEGGYTIHIPTNKEMPIFDAAMEYKKDSIPTIIIAGKEYGSGSSRDWAAKGPKLQGVRAVLTESFERIHRSNLVGMGILPLQFKDGESAESLGLKGTEEFSISGINSGEAKTVKIKAESNESTIEFEANVRIDTPQEIKYFKSGGILQYVLKQIAA
jgi:aconitate hydratase|tara:strand:- start:13616 stop:16252 length:2637 start_codon:yes stop_codon:yes gene_type:complete